MNPNLTPQQLAELLARKCSINLDHFIIKEGKRYTQQELQEQILQSIPLVVLLECIDDYRKSAKCFNKIPTPLKNLDTKLTQLL